MKYEKIRSNKNEIIDGPLIIIPQRFGDDRGFFMESWNKNNFNKILNKEIKFVQDNHSNSKKNVIRGLHYQLPPDDQGKLVRCISGKIFDVIVDLRNSSNTFLSWAGVFLDNQFHKQLWIPSGFAHGFISLIDNSEIIYKTTSFWSKKNERTIRWDDPTLKINWPIDNNNPPLLSDKDRTSSKIENILKDELFM